MTEIIGAGLDGISISDVGNVSNREAQNILLDAVRFLAFQDVKGKL